MIPRAINNEFEKRTFTDPQGVKLPYRLLVPKGHDNGRKFPLVLYLHGAGEKGDDNEKQLANGAEQFASLKIRLCFPAFVVVPQCAPDQWWADSDNNPAAPLLLAYQALEALRTEFSIDDRRIYITGISMGGFGTWSALARWPGYFAAAVPVCGGGDPAKAGLVKDTPLWVFHGSEDQVVKVDYSRIMVAAVRRAGGKPRYTEYPDVGHNSWDLVYRDEEMYTWLFSQKKEAAGGSGV